MNDDDMLPTPWRNARKGRTFADTMSMDGRSLSTSGRFKSRPGAPQSPTDTMAGLSMTRPNSGLSDNSTWNSFFAKSQMDTAKRFGGIPSAAPSLAPSVPTDATAMAEAWSGLPKAPAAPDLLRSASQTLSQFSQMLGGAPTPAGLSFSGLKYQTPGTIGRVDDFNDLRRKPGSRWFRSV